MKKILYFAAMAALLLVSCNQDEPKINEPEKKTDAFTFKASIEDLATSGNAGSSSNVAKATINGSYGLNWATGDKIGIYFPTWGDKNQQFNLTSGEGTTNGEFSRNDSGDYNPSDASAAFFPWQGTGSSNNNVYEGTMYFKLKSEYWSYDNGDMLTPLVASISDAGNISFKHAGAAVKLTVNNLVSGTYKVKMSVEGKQITGDFHVNPANAGTDALALDAEEVVSNNHITLNSWKSDGAFSWIFPVPALTSPKLTFEIIDENGVLVWSKSPKAQSSVGRAGLLVMPDLTINPYKEFDATSTTWTVCGDPNGWGDTKMVTDGSLCIAKSVTITANQQFKIRKDKAWTTSYGWDQLSSEKRKNCAPGSENNNIKVTADGTYDVIFNSSESAYNGFEAHEIRVVLSKYPYPIAKESAAITIDGSFSDWTSITPESAGNTTVKVVSDESNVYLYVQIANAASDIWNNNGDKYVYALFELDGDPTNDADQWGNKGDFILLLYPYGGTSASPAIITSSSSSAKAWICNPATAPYTVSNISLNGTFSDADGSGNRTVTYEFSIPRDDMPAIPTTDPITITIKGSKISSNVSISRTL